MDLESKYNTKSPAVKRLMREALELRSATDEYCARPLDDNLFEWHFTVRGAPHTDFQAGIYHGRILLPPDYPMKPPNIILLTPNGRFETNKKICLSISGHHPETWQPSWSIRTAMLALIAFMPTPGNGTIGSLDYTADERKQLARKSQSWKCDICGKMSDQLDKSIDNSNNSAITPDESNLINNVIFKGEETSDNNRKEAVTENSSQVTESLTQTSCAAQEAASSNNAAQPQPVAAAANTPVPVPPLSNLISDSTSNLLITILVAVIAFLIYRRIFLL
ncbi:ubiquitin-conjugating enzyme E2 J1 isoform X2 [Nilaparvata lugens]|uniref:ubiquitin-conjugating enzyme E2 J1 isoform X2 n=1 Tax=Nilaparvata lugens TaxID=108931 RepID=UPI00193CE016|nr:ubiquitin-conjugating enzyme E2 J1 isoform X2 [Nilaparvata lugens]